MLHNTDLSSQMVMGQGLRRYISLNPWNYIRPAPRLRVLTDVMLSGVELTDVSFYQKLIDFIKMKTAGIRGTIIRAGQNDWVDPFWVDNWGLAKYAGMPRGSYWLYDSRRHWRDQADLYWSLIKNDMGELMVTADYEESYGGPYPGWKNLYNFLERLLGNGVPLSKLWIYTGYYYWLDHSPQGDAVALAYFKKFRLWLPWYTSNPAYVKQPAPWIDPEDVPLWQNGTPPRGQALGVSTLEIDISQWTGNLASYQSYFNLGETPPPPPTGGAMLEIKSTVSTETRSVRNGPGIRHTKLRDLPVGGVARSPGTAEDLYTYPADVPDSSLPTGYAARAGDQWLRINEINGIPVTSLESWLAVIHLGKLYTILTDLNAPPANDAPPQEVRVIDESGVTWVADSFTKL